VSLRRRFLFPVLSGLMLIGLLLVCQNSAEAREASTALESRVGITLGYPDFRGAFPVTSVLYGTPGDRGGLRVGDAVFPLAEAESSPQGVLEYLSRKLEAGYSVILQGEREGVPQTYWLRPYRFSSSQEKLLALSLEMERHILSGKTLWEEALGAFDSFLYRSMNPGDLESRLSELRNELLNASGKLRNYPIPRELSPEIRGHLLAAREDYARAMDLRREGLLYLMEFAVSREDSLSLQQGRRREADFRARDARKLESRGAGELLQALRCASLGEEDMQLLRYRELGLGGGESRHPREFGESSLKENAGIFQQDRLTENFRKDYAFVLQAPWESNRFAHWAGEELLVFWKGETPKYLFVWTGAMWYQIALREGESLGEGLQRNRDTLKQQREQNRFRVPQEDLPNLISLGEEGTLGWMGILAW